MIFILDGQNRPLCLEEIQEQQQPWKKGVRVCRKKSLVKLSVQCQSLVQHVWTLFVSLFWRASIQQALLLFASQRVNKKGHKIWWLKDKQLEEMISHYSKTDLFLTSVTLKSQGALKYDRHFHKSFVNNRLDLYRSHVKSIWFNVLLFLRP